MEHMEDIYKILIYKSLFFHNLPQSSTALHKKGKRMTHEPHHCHSVSIRAVMPTDEKTLEQYQAEVAARFGGKMPSWPELAKREDAALRRAIGQSPLDVSNPTGINAPKLPRMDIVRASWQQKIAAIHREFIAALAKPATSGDVARILGITPRAAHSRLTNMADKGLVVRRLVKSVAVWERRQEAAE